MGWDAKKRDWDESKRMGTNETSRLSQKLKKKSPWATVEGKKRIKKEPPRENGKTLPQPSKKIASSRQKAREATGSSEGL